MTAKLRITGHGAETYADFYWCESCQHSLLGDASEQDSTPVYCPFCGVKFTELVN